MILPEILRFSHQVGTWILSWLSILKSMQTHILTSILGNTICSHTRTSVHCNIFELVDSSDIWEFSLDYMFEMRILLQIQFITKVHFV